MAKLSGKWPELLISEDTPEDGFSKVSSGTLTRDLAVTFLFCFTIFVLFVLFVFFPRGALVRTND